MTEGTIAMNVLEKLPVFQGMNEAERQQILAVSDTMEFAPGEVVLRQGKRSQNLLVVLEGRCQVVKEAGDRHPGSFVLAEFGPRDHFGDMSFFRPAPHSANVRATTELKLLRVQRKDYDILLADQSLAAYKLAYNLLDGLADRLRRMDGWVSELLLDDSHPRATSEWSSFRDKMFNGWNF
jgi:CRP-like cAMP-binding protein